MRAHTIVVLQATSALLALVGSNFLGNSWVRRSPLHVAERFLCVVTVGAMMPAPDLSSS
jgi:hypothetical protein